MVGLPLMPIYTLLSVCLFLDTTLIPPPLLPPLRQCLYPPDHSVQLPVVLFYRLLFALRRFFRSTIPVSSSVPTLSYRQPANSRKLPGCATQRGMLHIRNLTQECRQGWTVLLTRVSSGVSLDTLTGLHRQSQPFEWSDSTPPSEAGCRYFKRCCLTPAGGGGKL
jgi:hypothetical protein